MKDVRIEISVRNNLILTKMEHRGIRTVAELFRRMELPNSKRTALYRLVNMLDPARNEDGRWDMLALKLADFFDCEPAELFSDAQQDTALEKNRSHAEIAFSQMQLLTARNHGEITPELECQAKELRAAVSEALQTLTPREERVLRLRFVEEMTLEEAGAEFSVTRERIREIEAKALRKLKHPSRLRRIFAATGFITRKRMRWGEEVVEHVIDEEVFKAL